MPSSSALWASIGPVDQVADRVDARDVRLEVLVDGDLAGLRVDARRRPLPGPALGVRPPADGDEHLVARRTSSGLAVLRLGRDGHLAALDLRPGDLASRGGTSSPCLPSDLVQQAADLGVGQRHDPREELDDCDLRSEPLPDRAELQADVAAADDDQVLRHLVEARAPRSS